MAELPNTQYHYNQSERLDLLIHSIKANTDCKPERKQFNLCRANLLGKYVEPNFCLENANSLINCYQTTRKDHSDSCKNRFKAVFECAKTYDSAGRFSFSSSCDKELTAYLEC